MYHKLLGDEDEWTHSCLSLYRGQYPRNNRLVEVGEETSSLKQLPLPLHDSHKAAEFFSM